jgi:hypothetical protein
MTYRQSFPHDRETPDEYESDDAISCEDCGEEFDETELGDAIKSVGGDYLCRSCILNREQEEPEPEDQQMSFAAFVLNQLCATGNEDLYDSGI